jgi:DNA-binding IclR family transcriptional regulator
MRSDRRNETLKTVERTIGALFELARGGDLGARELGRRLGYTKSGVHRILTTLVAHHLVRQDVRTKRYHLGYGILNLSAALTRGNNLIQATLPRMQRLTEVTRETSCLYVRRHLALIPIAQVESRQELRSVVELNSALPLYCGAASKVLLAFMSSEELGEVRAELRFRPLTSKTPKSWRSLAQDLQLARERGWAISWGENTEGVVGVAAPIWSAEGRVVAAVGVYGPTSRIHESSVERLARVVVEAAAGSSRALGFLADGSAPAAQAAPARVSQDGSQRVRRRGSPG